MGTSGAEAGSQRREVATLGGGCFWCLQPVFEELVGVEQVTAGYAGGSASNPSYRDVCTGTTGHAEVVQISFDPQAISFEELLRVFFAVHDPTTRDRQGADVGTQYRSVIFWHDEGQRETARRVIRDLDVSETWDAPLVTELVPFQAFYPAEEYHQGYFSKNPGQGYCRVVIAPKLTKLRQSFAEKLKSS
jgi:peptide-methionine (S)-S-oxide reductase